MNLLRLLASLACISAFAVLPVRAEAPAAAKTSPCCCAPGKTEDAGKKKSDKPGKKAGDGKAKDQDKAAACCPADAKSCDGAVKCEGGAAKGGEGAARSESAPACCK